MLKIITKPEAKNECDLLVGNEHSPLMIVGLDEDHIATVMPPDAGWAHESLELAANASQLQTKIDEGANAYLQAGNERTWIGSTEV